MATTPNFNWSTPDNTGLVKNGALDIRTLGNSIDASLVDLKGGTTGQVLAKASNTDMDFVWSADAAGISPTIFAAKGDLLGASANDTPAILSVGANGETLVADSSTSTGLRYTSLFGANKNKLFNGDFYVNQRGFTTGNTDGVYGFDRWRMNLSGGSATYTAETFTAGAAPVAGYEGKNYAKVTVTTGNDFLGLLQRVEDVRTFAGQTITVSFWAKGVNPTTNNGLYVWLIQSFGTGGSPSSNVATESSKITLSASWARYSVTLNVPSISGKTLGTNNDSYLQVSIGQASNASTDAWTLEVWGVQAEAGSVATAFQTATGTIQGELAACQRYYYTLVAGTNGTFGTAGYYSSSDVLGTVFYPVQMRTAPTFSAAAGSFYEVVRNGAANALTGLSANFLGQLSANIFAGSAQGASGTAGHAGQYRTTSASANIAFSAEL